MKTFFLKIKSWQLFVLIIFLPMLLTLAYEMCVSSLTNHTDGILSSPVWAFSIYLLDLVWIYSIGIYFSSQLNQTPKYLTPTFIISLLYISYYSFYVIGNFSAIGESWTATLRHFSIQIVFMVAFVYMVYQASKALRAVELNREVNFRDAFADFFCFLFFPVGIWFVQPRVRKLFALNEQTAKPEQATQP